jgi:1,4-dihydroxy-2-naphthoyl-CoA hydrolase
MAFVHQRRVRFQDADPAGIVFFAHVLTFCHEAYEELLRAEGLPLERLLVQPPGYPLRHATVDFLGPLRIGMLVGIEVSVGKLSERSYRLDYTLQDEGGAPLAKASTVHVAVDRATMRPTALPEDLRAALARHLSA